MTLYPKPLPRAPFLLSVALALTLAGSCNSTPDKRLLQNLNTQGFGNRYSGNAEEENWVAIGDRIQVTDSYHPDEIEANVAVDIDGTVLLPEIGTVQVAGRTRSEIEALLMEKYSPYHDLLDVKVEITTGGKQYFVFGEVARQGPKPLSEDLTIPDAVAAADPKADTADLHRVVLLRARKRIVFDLSDGSRLRDANAWPRVKPGDVLYVPTIPVPEPEHGPDAGDPVLLAVGGGRTP